MMTSSFTIGEKNSLEDFRMAYASKEIGRPPKNSIRESVPYMNGEYDFSSIMGAATFGSRTLRFTFELVGDSPEELDEALTPFANWCAQVDGEELIDEEVPGYKFTHVYFSSDELEEDESGLKLTYTVEFFAHPYRTKLSDNSKVI